MVIEPVNSEKSDRPHCALCSVQYIRYTVQPIYYIYRYIYNIYMSTI